MPNIRKPAIVHRLNGNPSKKRIKDDLKAGGRPFVVPDTAEAQARIVKAIIAGMPPEVYAQTDSWLIGLYAYWAVEFYRVKKITEQPDFNEVVVSDKGNLSIHPLKTRLQVCTKMLVPLGARLCLDPVARAQIDVVLIDEPEEPTPRLDPKRYRPNFSVN